LKFVENTEGNIVGQVPAPVTTDFWLFRSLGSDVGLIDAVLSGKVAVKVPVKGVKKAAVNAWGFDTAKDTPYAYFGLTV